MARTLGAIVLVALLYGATFGRVGGLIAAGLGTLESLLAAGGVYSFFARGVLRARGFAVRARGFAACFICIHGPSHSGSRLRTTAGLVAASRRLR